VHNIIEIQPDSARTPAPPSSSSLRPSLRDKIRAALEAETVPTLKKIAVDLSTSPRTLQRRLANANASFQGELDTVREALAAAYLDDGQVPVAEVALRLGYSNRAAFERAFRRWRGITPGQYRRRKTVA
jgi:AraC-like DNA-binding protein